MPEAEPFSRTLDLVGLDVSSFDMFCAGYSSGAAWGLDEGRRRADEEAQGLHRRAARVVHAMAEVPSHDELEARRRTYRPWGGGAE